MVAWSIELSENDIQFSPRGSIKSHVLADFVVELTSPIQEETPHVWLLSVDGSSNVKGSGAEIVLEGSGDLLIEQSLRFEFKEINNQAGYEALIAGMNLAKEMGAERFSTSDKSNNRRIPDKGYPTRQIPGKGNCCN